MRFKDGKVHYYWSMVENVRVGRRVFRIARGEARIRFISGRPRKRTVDDKQMALPGV